MLVHSTAASACGEENTAQRHSSGSSPAGKLAAVCPAARAAPCAAASLPAEAGKIKPQFIRS